MSIVIEEEALKMLLQDWIIRLSPEGEDGRSPPVDYERISQEIMDDVYELSR